MQLDSRTIYTGQINSICLNVQCFMSAVPDQRESTRGCEQWMITEKKR